MKVGSVAGVVVIGLLVGAIYLFFRPQQKSNTEKYAGCIKTADQIHDSSRKIITANVSGYSKDEQAYYYLQTENGYARDLNNCRQLYSQ